MSETPAEEEEYVDKIPKMAWMDEIHVSASYPGAKIKMESGAEFALHPDFEKKLLQDAQHYALAYMKKELGVEANNTNSSFVKVERLFISTRIGSRRSPCGSILLTNGTRISPSKTFLKEKVHELETHIFNFLKDEISREEYDK